MNATNVYVDANVFISPVIYEKSRRAKSAADVLKLIEKGRITAYTSTLTWDEVVWVVRKTLGRADSVEAGKKLLSFPNLRFIPASEEIARSAQGLVADWDLAPRDAIHLASALSRGADVVVSDDPDFDVLKRMKRESPDSFVKGKDWRSTDRDL